MKDNYFFDQLDQSIEPEITKIGKNYVECCFRQSADTHLTFQSRVLLQIDKQNKRIKPLYLFTILDYDGFYFGNKCMKFSYGYGANYSFEEDLFNYLKTHNSSRLSQKFYPNKDIIRNSDGTVTYYKFIPQDKYEGVGLQLMIKCDEKTKTIVKYNASVVPAHGNRLKPFDPTKYNDLTLPKKDLIETAEFVFHELDKEKLLSNLQNLEEIKYDVEQSYKDELVDKCVLYIKNEIF